MQKVSVSKTDMAIERHALSRPLVWMNFEVVLNSLTLCFILIDFRNLEESIIHLLLTHGSVLEPSRFLTKCTVCNGEISEVKSLDAKALLFESVQAPNDPNVCLYSCIDCSQPYWWSDRPDSSASRVKTRAADLFRLAIRANVPFVGDLALFDFVDVEAERQLGTGSNNLSYSSLEVVEWMNESQLKHYFKLKSACDDIVFTNVTSDFVGALDHIFYEHERWVVTKKLYVPKSFKELNSRGTTNGHLLPSAKWPSSHLPIGAMLAFKPIPKHANDCSCGCIPTNIFSVFEMAEMRKQLRAKKDEESHHHDHEHSDVYYNSEEEYL